MIKAACVGMLVIMLGGCGGGSSNDTRAGLADPPVPQVTTAGTDRLPVSVTWHLQLQGNINTAYPVEMYDIDLFDTPASVIQQLQAKGIKIICYFSAGSYENWRTDANQFPGLVIGSPLEGWAGENWLDIRSDKVRQIMVTRLDLAKQKGCDGVDPDNMDGYSNNSGFNLSASDQLAYNRFIAKAAHARGLLVGLKNDLEQIGQLADYFDFAINEQCFEYSECDLLAPFIDGGKPVLHIEYKKDYVNNSGARQMLCNASVNRQFSTLVLPLALDDSFRLSCR